ncbi:hypothetical protein FOA43_002346 [Brettanomyces nanus]|uniref:Uncharacterized protein n=1 Tax=Eeniella nana TaxID=13502 RepID=A0A875S0T2_EENNA|nr:uncharacterized protein FOA43_002346 [Brettanomyces nanus]QPG75006.1 hypothetical protein FOA43_002346 [Brettanomyces nanus]
MNATISLNITDINFQVGIDFLFFDVKSYSRFKGIKLIPSGCHLLHITNVLTNTRIGRFVNFEKNDFVEMSFDPETETIELKTTDRITTDEQTYITKMVNYKSQSEAKAQIIQSRLLNVDYKKFIDNDKNQVTSNDPTPIESLKLDEEIMKKHRQDGRKDHKFVDKLLQDLEKLNSNQLKLSIIDGNDKRTFVRDGSKDRTKDYLDRTWLINKLHGGSFEGFIEEFKFCFLMTIIINNYGSYLQWKTLMDLFLNSIGILNHKTEESKELMEIIKIQLQVITSLRVGEEEEQPKGEFFQVDLSELHRSFKECLLNMDTVEDVGLKFRYNEIIGILNGLGLDVCDELSEE